MAKTTDLFQSVIDLVIFAVFVQFVGIFKLLKIRFNIGKYTIIIYNNNTFNLFHFSTIPTYQLHHVAVLFSHDC